MDRKQPSDDFSLERLQAGDRVEFARLVDTYYPLIYRLAIKMLGNAQDAEDILQETFIKTFQHIGTFDGRSSLSTWLYRIATNEALMFLRKKRPEFVSVEEPAEAESEEQDPLQIVDFCCMPEEELMSAEAQAQLDRAIDELPASLRIVFVLRDLQGLSTRETAEVLDLSEMAVKTRLSRARLRLRDLLSSYFADRMAQGRKDQ
jgi:RNA polymerase sigma-70 factor (ECF subfamily)